MAPEEGSSRPGRRMDAALCCHPHGQKQPQPRTRAQLMDFCRFHYPAERSGARPSWCSQTSH